MLRISFSLNQKTERSAPGFFLSYGPAGRITRPSAGPVTWRGDSPVTTRSASEQSGRRSDGFRRRRPRRAGFRPALEVLEERALPSVTLTISSPAPVPEGDTGTTNMVFT